MNTESNNKEKNKKTEKGLIATIVLGLLGIVLPPIISPYITNVFLAKIVLLLYCIRFELITILLLIALIFLFSCFLKSAKKVSRLLYIGTTLVILAAIALSIKPAYRYCQARYFYYITKALYKDESQKHFLDKAKSHMNAHEWELGVQDLTQANALYKESYYKSEINDAIDEAKLIISFGELLHNSYVKPVANIIPLNSFKCAQELSCLYPSKYEKEYMALRDSVELAIDSYQKLYDAVEDEDYEASRELILRYGWCWFEPMVWKKLSYDKEESVMKWLKQYIGAEDLYTAQSRIETNWFEE